MTPRTQIIVVLACVTALLVMAVGIVFFVDHDNPHAPISITDNLSFTQENGVSQGNGSPQDPYIIEGWDIVAPSNGSGIYIANTDAHLLIRNVDIRSNGSSWFGIYLEYTRNVTVENSRMTGNWNGVRTYDCSNITIRNCRASSNVYTGFQVCSSENVSVIDSRAADNPQANLWVESSTTCDISGNDCQDNGILIQWSTNITYIDNVMVNSDLCVYNCSGCIVSRNEFVESNALLWEADYCAFEENTMIDDSYLEILNCEYLTTDRDYPYPPGP